jgi:hypothetical protein
MVPAWFDGAMILAQIIPQDFPHLVQSLGIRIAAAREFWNMRKDRLLPVNHSVWVKSPNSWTFG